MVRMLSSQVSFCAFPCMSSRSHESFNRPNLHTACRVWCMTTRPHVTSWPWSRMCNLNCTCDSDREGRDWGNHDNERAFPFSPACMTAHNTSNTVAVPQLPAPCTSCFCAPRTPNVEPWPSPSTLSTRLAAGKGHKLGRGEGGGARRRKGREGLTSYSRRGGGGVEHFVR